MMTDDMELVRTYAENGSEQAFSTVVSRHIDLVYSVSFRCVRDAHLAEEITQAVFCILAKKAKNLNSSTILPAWLCRTARNASANALTIQRRRQYREQEAYMQSNSEDSEANAWMQIEPLLDSAMADLGQKEHAALVLRFFEGQNFKKVASALGTTEAGAKMRVGRALDKLRKIFTKHGLTLSTALIAATMSANSIQAAPIGLAATVTATAAKGTATAATLTLIKTTLKVMAWNKLKSATAIGALALFATTATTLTVQYTLKASETAGTAFSGYATPEATLKSMTWALSKLDFKKFEDACTPERAEVFRKKRTSKTEAEFKKEASATAQAYASYDISRKQVISDTEVHLYVHALSSEGDVSIGDLNPIMKMKKIGAEWKYDGDIRE